MGENILPQSYFFFPFGEKGVSFGRSGQEGAAVDECKVQHAPLPFGGSCQERGERRRRKGREGQGKLAGKKGKGKEGRKTGRGEGTA